MANRKMTLLKTKLAQSVSSSMSSKAKNLGIATALLLSSSNAWALGLGSLEVASNLDQPLSGTIELRVSDGDDLDTLTAVIASREDFESLGIDYPSYLENFSLLLDTIGGERLLRVTSNNIVIKEPFIHFLVRVQWSGGSFLREYTALIDPPVYAAEAPSSISEPKEVGTDQTYQPNSSADDADEPLIEDNFYNDDDATSGQESVSSAEEFPTDASYGPVESGESLSVIAQDLQRQFPDLSIYQIMKVLFDENQSSFIGANINGLIKGSILNIGDLSAIRAIDVSESRAFYSQQIQDWNPQLLQASSSDSLNVGQDSYSFQDDSSFTSDSTETDNFGSQDSFQVGASSESNDDVSSDQGSSRDGEVLALSREVSSLQSSLASSELENQELSERISLLEGQLADMNRLAELSIEDADLSVLESTLAEQNNRVDDLDATLEELTEDTTALDEFLTSPDDLADDADSAIDSLAESTSSIDEFLADDESVDGLDDVADFTEDSGLESVIEEANGELDDVTPAIETKAPLVVEREPSFIEKAKSSFFEGGLWKILAGLGGLLVIGGGLLFMRRRQADEEFEISMLSIESNSHSVGQSNNTASASVSTSHTASLASEAANADKETSFLTVYSDSDAVVQADEVDPVAEADVYIAYGRDEQAEEVLLDGVVSHPDRVDIKQKLLSLYHKRQNAEGFERIAEELYSQRAALTGDIWQQVCDMGKEVAPSNPLFELSGEDLHTAEEADSELLLEGGDISEVPLEPASIEFEAVEDAPINDAPTEDDNADLEFVGDAVEDNNDDLVDHLDHSLADKHDDIDDALTMEDKSELVVDSLNSDESIQLVNFDDGRSQVSELDEVEIDALGFGDGSIDLSGLEKADDVDLSLNDDDGELLDFNLDDADLENAVGDVSEVSDLEIDSDYDEARTQYELAKVFVDLGDEDGARKILVELVANEENSDDVLNDAQALLDSISS